MIEDTALAIIAYPVKNAVDDPGKHYLRIYGLLQAMFLQQDATENLCEALAIKYDREEYPQLKAIRRIRNITSGHPTKKRNGKDYSYHGLIRISLSPTKFEILSYLPDGRLEHKDVSIPEVLDNQADDISNILQTIITKLEEEDKRHKRKFMNEKLADFFPSQLDYFFQNVFEAILTDNPARVGQGIAGFNQIKKTLSSLKDSLSRRGIPDNTYPGIGECIQNLERPMEKVETYLQSRWDSQSPTITDQDATIFTEYIQRQFSDLKQMAQGIDEEYAN